VARGDNAREGRGGRGRQTRRGAGVVGEDRSSGKCRAATAIDLFPAPVIFEGLPQQVLAIDHGIKAATNAVALVSGSTKFWTVMFLAFPVAPPLDLASLGKASDFLAANGSTAVLTLPVPAADLLLTFGTKLGDILRGLVCRTRARARARARTGPVEFRRMDREDRTQKRNIVCEY